MGVFDRPESSYLLYDSDCGPCTRFMRLAKKMDFLDRLKPVPLRSGFAHKLVRGRLSEEKLFGSFHLVVTDESGKSETQIFSAGDGLLHLLPYFPLGSLAFAPARKFRLTRGLFQWIYKRMARQRERSGSCVVHS